MIAPSSRIRQIGWLALLAVCLMLFVALTFRVNAVKSEVVRAERQIIALERETQRLETEYQTRANQQQLANWNKVDFGYAAPRADQFLETERQLARLGEGGAPAPIRVARAPDETEAGDSSLMAMVSPLTGLPASKPSFAAQRNKKSALSRQAGVAASLADRLGAPIDMPSGQAELTE